MSEPTSEELEQAIDVLHKAVNSELYGRTRFGAPTEFLETAERLVEMAGKLRMEESKLPLQVRVEQRNNRLVVRTELHNGGWVNSYFDAEYGYEETDEVPLDLRVFGEQVWVR